MTIGKYGAVIIGGIAAITYKTGEYTVENSRLKELRAAANRAREQKWQQQERERTQKLGLIEPENDSKS